MEKDLKPNDLCPQCKNGKLAYDEEVIRGGVKYTVLSCPKCGSKFRIETSPKP